MPASKRSLSGAVDPKAVHGLFWDVMTFDRLLTGPITHLIYWAGLGIIAIIGFGMVGAAVGLAVRDASISGLALALALLVAELLVMAALVLIWRGVCEFYMAVFRIADDLRALRLASDAAAVPARPAPEA